MASEVLAADAASHGGGLPQLNFETWPSQILWLAITLIALYVILTTIALPRIQATLEERQDTIANDLDLAAEYDQKALEAAAAYQADLEKARAEARKIADRNQAAIKLQLDEALAEAEASIAAKTAESRGRLDAIRAEAGATAQQVALAVTEALVERFSPTAVDPATVRAAVSHEVQSRFEG